MAQNGVVLALVSILLLASLVFLMMPPSEPDSPQKDGGDTQASDVEPLVMYCAAGIRPAVAETAEAFAEETFFKKKDDEKKAYDEHMEKEKAEEGDMVSAPTDSIE